MKGNLHEGHYTLLIIAHLIHLGLFTNASYSFLYSLYFNLLDFKSSESQQYIYIYIHMKGVTTKYMFDGLHYKFNESTHLCVTL